MAFFQRYYNHLGLEMPTGVQAPEALYRLDGLDQSIIDRTGNGHDLDGGGPANIFEPAPFGLRGFQASAPNILANGINGVFPTDPNPGALRIAKDITGVGNASLTIDAIVHIRAVVNFAPVVTACWKAAGVLGTADVNFLWDLRTNGLGGNWQLYYEFGTGGTYGTNFLDFGTNEKSRDVTVLVTMTQSADGQTRKLYLDGALKSTITAQRAEKHTAGNAQSLLFCGNWTFEAMKGVGISLRITAQEMTATQVASVADSVIGGRIAPVGPLWSKNTFDTDGKRFLDGTQINDVHHAESNLTDSFWTGIGHYGADYTGQLRFNGTACAFADFGTIASGLRRTAWADETNPMAAQAVLAGSYSFPSDGVIRMTTGAANPGFIVDQNISSNLRWYILAGNFDFRGAYSNFSPTGNDLCAGWFLFSNIGGVEGSSGVRLRRCRVGGVEYYEVATFQNGVFGNQTLLGTADTAGILRAVRTSGSFTFYGGATGTTQIGPALGGLGFGQEDLFVMAQLVQNNTTGSCDFASPTMFSGSTSSLIGWARNANPDQYRGNTGPMPTDLVVTAHGDEKSLGVGGIGQWDFDHGGLSIIDGTNQKLWMQLNQVTNNAIFGVGTTAGEMQLKTRFRNGVLMGAHFTLSGTDQGGGYVIDFSTGSFRVATGGAGNPQPGEMYSGSFQRSVDPIARANDALNYNRSDASWTTQTKDILDVDMWFDSGKEYYAFGTATGLTVLRQTRWDIDGQYGINTADDCVSNDSNTMVALAFDQSNGRLFFMASNSLYSADKTTWEAAMPAGSFATDDGEALLGTEGRPFSQRRIIIIGSDVYVARDEGVYRHEAWPANSLALYYGKSGSGATHEILPDYDRVISIAGDSQNLAIAMAKDFDTATTVFLDNFDNSTVDLQTDASGGSFSESGTKLSIICPAASSTWPIAYEQVSTQYSSPVGLIRFETRLEQLTRSGQDCHAGLVVAANRNFMLHFGFIDIGLVYVLLEGVYRGVFKAGIDTTGAGVSDPNTTPHIYRLYWNPQDYPIAIENLSAFVAPKSLSFWYSLDDGSTFTILHGPINGRFADFTVDWFGCFARNFSTNPSVTADFSYLKMEDFTGGTGPVAVIDTTTNIKVQQNETVSSFLTEPRVVAI
jgi:hypothetical protein